MLYVRIVATYTHSKLKRFTDVMDKTNLIDPELLLKVIGASNDGIVVAEKEGDDTILIYVNDAFEKMTGYSAEEILYQDCRFLQGDDRDQAVGRKLRHAIDNNQPCQARIRNYKKDGTMFWNQLSLTPVLNNDDQLTYYIGIQKDVTKEVQLLEHLKTTYES